MASGDSILKRLEAAQALISERSKAQDHLRAIQTLQEIIQDPEFGDAQTWLQSSAHYALGSLYARTGDRIQAVTSLRRAVDRGYEGYRELRTDRNWEPLRGEPEFEALLSIVQSRGDYVMLLRQYAGYDESETNDQIVFAYQASCDPNLVNVRRELDLDTVAGDGEEISRLLRLLQWAHNVVRHDGNSDNPEPRNSLHLIAVCREQNRGVNCRMMATILNEAYLSMGFCSRMVTCLPLNAEDPDCHVITAVYAPSLDKWLHMDPTFGAYLADEQGCLLSVAQVRARLISGEPIVVNQDANWNDQPTGPGQYLHYMSKNLATVVCPTSSEFGFEAKPRDERRYVMLAPAALLPNEQYLNHAGVGQGDICRNQAVFWQSPAPRPTGTST